MVVYVITLSTECFGKGSPFIWFNRECEGKKYFSGYNDVILAKFGDVDADENDDYVDGVCDVDDDGDLYLHY